jgi:hypothetical protein
MKFIHQWFTIDNNLELQWQVSFAIKNSVKKIVTIIFK